MSLYASDVAYSVEQDLYPGIPADVHYASEFRYQVVTVEEPKPARKPRRKALDDKPTVIVGMVLAGLVGAAIAAGASYGFVTHDRQHHAAPVVRVAPKTYHVTHLKYWVHIGPSSLRIEV